jgi:acetyl esterase
MNSIKVTLLWISLFVFASGSPGSVTGNPVAPGANADVSGVKQIHNPDKSLVFKKTPQGDLKVYCFLPKDWKAEDRRPGMVFWFGGGFVGGTPTQFYAKAEYLALRGLVCLCAEYRVRNTHGTGLDKCVEDARSAMRWVKQHAAELGVDPERVIASGGSAGGTLSLLMALGDGPDSADDDLTISPRPCALVLFNPAQGDAAMKRIEGEGEEQKRAVRAVAMLNEPKKDLPPSLFFFGTADLLLSPSRQFCETSLALGNRCELWTAKGKPHGFFNWQPWHDATLRKTDEFLTGLGYLKGEPQIKAPTEAVLKRELPK